MERLEVFGPFFIEKVYLVGQMLLPENIANQKILISPLDWGMGHTTRCISLIRQLTAQGNIVHFAGNEQQIEFINKDFPGLICKVLDGYNVTFNSDRSAYRQMMVQSFKIKKAIKDEHKWLGQELRNENYDLVISDNRYGFRNEKIPSIILTHQLNLQIPRFRKNVNRILTNYVNQFDICWIPDDPNDPVCGEMTNWQLKIPVKHIGLLNRFNQINSEIVYDKAIILSGPEPERSRFEKKMIDFYKDFNGRIALIGSKISRGSITAIDQPSTRELEKIINQSGQIISRAGYTTIMEMISLNKTCILIPTRNQYEQLYLSQSLCKENINFLSEEDFLRSI